MLPLVSVIMPARNVERFVGPAIASVRRQTLSEWELIVIDDRSADRTAEVVRRHSDGDPRIRLISGHGGGPGAARNLGLSIARGRWCAVVDADDEILLTRLADLLEIAQAGAQLVADNVTAFYGDGRADHIWLAGGDWGRSHTISLEAFLASGIEGQSTDQPGYLKPMFDRSWFEERALRYDESLTIGEDYDLVARALAAGAIYRFTPEAGYRYRRHAGSTSYRISTGQLISMTAAFERLRPGLSPSASAVLDRRIAGLEHDQCFTKLVEELKGRSPRALWRLLVQRNLRRRFVRSVCDGLQRRLSAR